MEDYSECSELSLSESLWEALVVILDAETEVETEEALNERLEQALRAESVWICREYCSCCSGCEKGSRN